ncbi:hypothetical protein SAMN05192573_101372 [Mucilaginibacter gossypii]|uniref:Uncharacterized protein n=1 Tax=Mucilaginibacter gossypii TaxID=551996 RepID=A0A1G7NW42_9SPHI|nr:hypothetical protein SAMN05192573_101372 [Mucilaginibacter gossypii]
MLPTGQNLFELHELKELKIIRTINLFGNSNSKFVLQIADFR